MQRSKRPDLLTPTWGCTASRKRMGRQAALFPFSIQLSEHFRNYKQRQGGGLRLSQNLRSIISLVGHLSWEAEDYYLQNLVTYSSRQASKAGCFRTKVQSSVHFNNEMWKQIKVTRDLENKYQRCWLFPTAEGESKRINPSPFPTLLNFKIQ